MAWRRPAIGRRESAFEASAPNPRIAEQRLQVRVCSRNSNEEEKELKKRSYERIPVDR